MAVERPLHVHESDAKRLPQGWPTLPDGCANQDQEDRRATEQPHRGDFSLTDLHHRPPFWETGEHTKTRRMTQVSPARCIFCLSIEIAFPIVLSSSKRCVYVPELACGLF